MLLIPIGTDVRLRRSPVANHFLILANIVIFAFTDVIRTPIGMVLKEYWTLDAGRPLFWQYITYQFMHGDFLHLLGNMLFLWIFGNAVCDRMGSIAYLLFYLAGGIFAGITFAWVAENPIVGASGSIAAVTTAFLALYPRVQIHMFIWVFFFITRFALPASVLITLKIILWDNIIAPSIHSGPMQNVAHSAHLGGYAFGFIVAITMLYLRALPRNQFDLPALWDRWRRREGYVMPVPSPVGRARPIRIDAIESHPLHEMPLSENEQLRETVVDALRRRDYEAATRDYATLLDVEPALTLPRPQLLDLANYLAQTAQHALAATAYQQFLAAYPQSADAPQVHLLLGMILNRYLRDYRGAIQHLERAAVRLSRDAEKQLARRELEQATTRLG
ncbi:MAG: rhomboid family intramembrane serine protease [Phycisphaerae bacterium]